MVGYKIVLKCKINPFKTIIILNPLELLHIYMKLMLSSKHGLWWNKYLFPFRWIRYNIRASVMCAIRAMGTVEHLAWTPSVCQPAGCMQGVTSSSRRRRQPTPPSTSTPTCTAIYPYTTSPTCPDHCYPPSTPPLRSHTARLEALTCTKMHRKFPVFPLKVPWENFLLFF